MSVKITRKSNLVIEQRFWWERTVPGSHQSIGYVKYTGTESTLLGAWWHAHLDSRLRARAKRLHARPDKTWRLP